MHEGIVVAGSIRGSGKTTVELLTGFDLSHHCYLPALPEARTFHTISSSDGSLYNLLLCGGRGTSHSCIKLSGVWTAADYTLKQPRRGSPFIRSLLFSVVSPLDQ